MKIKKFKVGDRVVVNDTYPYGYHGREGTVIDMPGFQKGKGKWAKVLFDDDQQVVKWNEDYFNLVDRANGQCVQTKEG